MKVIIGLLILLSFVFTNSNYAQEAKTKPNKISDIKHPESRVKFDPSKDADKDIKDAVAEANKTGKNILLDVGGEWCIWCHRLDQLFETNKDLYDYLHDNFVVVKVNYSKENKNETVLSRYPKVAGYPHMFVLDKDGKLLHSQNTGDFEVDGHHDKTRVMNFLKEWTAKKKA